jgi:hypothetical protein
VTNGFQEKRVNKCLRGVCQVSLFKQFIAALTTDAVTAKTALLEESAKRSGQCEEQQKAQISSDTYSDCEEKRSKKDRQRWVQR